MVGTVGSGLRHGEELESELLGISTALQFALRYLIALGHGDKLDGLLDQSVDSLISELTATSGAAAVPDLEVASLAVSEAFKRAKGPS